MSFVFEIIREGDGRGFNRVGRRRSAKPYSKWAGRWADFYEAEKYPRTWKIRKALRKVGLK